MLQRKPFKYGEHCVRAFFHLLQKHLSYVHEHNERSTVYQVSRVYPGPSYRLPSSPGLCNLNDHKSRSQHFPTNYNCLEPLIKFQKVWIIIYTKSKVALMFLKAMPDLAAWHYLAVFSMQITAFLKIIYSLQGCGFQTAILKCKKELLLSEHVQNRTSIDIRLAINKQKPSIWSKKTFKSELRNSLKRQTAPFSVFVLQLQSLEHVNPDPPWRYWKTKSLENCS